MAPMRDGLDGENGLIGWQKQQARPSAHHYPFNFVTSAFGHESHFKARSPASHFGFSPCLRVARTRHLKRAYFSQVASTALKCFQPVWHAVLGP